jgi:hypothetical protein
MKDSTAGGVRPGIERVSPTHVYTRAVGSSAALGEGEGDGDPAWVVGPAAALPEGSEPGAAPQAVAAIDMTIKHARVNVVRGIEILLTNALTGQCPR